MAFVLCTRHFSSCRFAVFRVEGVLCYVSEWDFVRTVIADAVMKPSTCSISSLFISSFTLYHYLTHLTAPLLPSPVPIDVLAYFLSTSFFYARFFFLLCAVFLFLCYCAVLFFHFFFPLGFYLSSLYPLSNVTLLTRRYVQTAGNVR